MTAHTNHMNIGLSNNDREKVADALSKILADSFLVYLKTHYFHWNVTGSMFQSLHLLFMDQYTELWNALDLIAERIRALGFTAPGTYRHYTALSSIEEEDGVPPADAMIQKLLKDQEMLIRHLRSALKIAEDVSDQPTADLLTQRMQIHEKSAWMLRSLLAP
jgi:starvation-inducible DNA-binding protein